MKSYPGADQAKVQKCLAVSDEAYEKAGGTQGRGDNGFAVLAKGTARKAASATSGAAIRTCAAPEPAPGLPDGRCGLAVGGAQVGEGLPSFLAHSLRHFSYWARQPLSVILRLVAQALYWISQSAWHSLIDGSAAPDASTSARANMNRDSTSDSRVKGRNHRTAGQRPAVSQRAGVGIP